MIASFLLLIFVLLFSFLVLIPEGKTYRINRVELKKISREFRDYSTFHSETQDTLQDLRSKNRRVITAFGKKFSPDRFERENKSYFSKLKVSSLAKPTLKKGFGVYEVNTTSEISSPKSFYNFLEAVNKSEYIIAINFPIDFTRDGESIKSSFTMNVYCDKEDINATASESKKK
jgi:hypothetical protein